MSNEAVEAAETWKQALDIIAGTIDPKPFKTWFKDTTAAYDGEMYIIECPTAFAKEWLYSRYGNVILSAVEQATGNDTVKIGFQTIKTKPEPINKDRVSLI